MIEFVLALLLGILAGTITGLTPSLHINLVVPFLLLISSSLFLPPLALAVFIVSLSITHVFLDFLPSIFLGAPDDSSGLAVLPGHSLLLKGQSHEALNYALYGCLSGLIIFILFIPLFIFIIPQVYPYLSSIMLLVLLFSVVFLFIKEKNKISALFIFLLAGFLGLSSLNIGLKEPLLPLFSGLFGASSILISLSKKTKIPEQSPPNKKTDKRTFFQPFIASFLASPLCSFLPALGSSQAAIIGTNFVEKNSEKSFLFMLGSINVSVMALSFLTLFSINKTRTGSAVFVQQLFSSFPENFLLLLIVSVLISGALAFLLSFYISKKFIDLVSKINYSLASKIILIFISLIVLLFSGFLGFLVYSVSSCIGILAIQLNIRRTHLLGCLTIPTILFYL